VNADGTSLAIVHRDVSPQNVIVGTDGVARLIDFGVAKAAERIAVTKDDALKGKLRYMSPEQGRREPVDRRSDVFSAGLVLHEALAGKPAIAGDDEATIWISLMLGELEPLPGVSPEVSAVLAGALEQQPEDRIPTALAFEQRLRAAIPPATPAEVGACVERHLGPRIASIREAIRAARRAGPASERSAAAPRVAATEPTAVTVGPPEPTRARRAPRALALSAAMLALVAVGVVLARRAPSASPKVESPVATRAAPAASEEAPVVSADATVAAPASAPSSARHAPVRAPAVRSAHGRGKLHDNPYPVAPR
jgi:serine/threonine-protein kinase